MNYRLLSIADAELAEAASWYETQATGLGREFLDEFEAVLDRIMRFPEAWTRIGARHRRCLFRRDSRMPCFTRTRGQRLEWLG